MSAVSDEQRQLNAQLRAQMDMMYMAAHPAQAQGIVGSSILGGAGQQGMLGNAWNTANTAYPYNTQETYTDINRQIRVDVTKADNGFILSIRPFEPGAKGRVLVATTIEELRDLITSEMVSRAMEK